MYLTYKHLLEILLFIKRIYTFYILSIQMKNIFEQYNYYKMNPRTRLNNAKINGLLSQKMIFSFVIKYSFCVVCNRKCSKCFSSLDVDYIQHFN